MTIQELLRDVDPETIVAHVFDDAGELYDVTFNWESAQNYALSEGLRVVAVRDDGRMTIADAQALYDAERARYRDCFGIEEMPAPAQVSP
jgi:hypothetical protein